MRDIRTTLLRCSFNVLTSYPSNVSILTSRATIGWATDLREKKLTRFSFNFLNSQSEDCVKPFTARLGSDFSSLLFSGFATKIENRSRVRRLARGGALAPCEKEEIICNFVALYINTYSFTYGYPL